MKGDTRSLDYSSYGHLTMAVGKSSFYPLDGECGLRGLEFKMWGLRRQRLVLVL